MRSEPMPRTPTQHAPVTMAGRPEGVAVEELAAGVVLRMSWVMR